MGSENFLRLWDLYWRLMDFALAEFSERSFFDGVEAYKAHFLGAIFNREVHFYYANFQKRVTFGRAKFNKGSGLSRRSLICWSLFPF